MHLRGRDDPYSSKCSLDCLELAKFHLAPAQRIHLHCFTGDRQLVQKWSHHFPRCYFGFTSLVRHFDDQQVLALQDIPKERILLETDSPYLRISKGTNTPAYLGEVAAAAARHLGLTTEEVIVLSAANARALYNI